MAAQVFSNKNAMAIQWCGENGLLKSKHWEETAGTLKLYNDWFDIFNSKNKYGQHNDLNAYGINLDKQNKTINNMTKFIEEMRIGQKKVYITTIPKRLFIIQQFLNRDVLIYPKATFIRDVSNRIYNHKQTESGRIRKFIFVFKNDRRRT